MTEHLSDLVMDELLVGLGSNTVHEAHLESCALCSERLAALSEARRGANQAPQFEAVFGRLCASTEAGAATDAPEAMHDRRGRKWWRLAMPLSAVVASFCFLLWTPTSDETGVRIKGTVDINLVRVDSAAGESTAGNSPLRPGERVALSVGSAGYRFVLVMAVDTSGTVSRVWPPQQPHSGDIPVGSRALLAPPFEITAGSVALHAFFSERPIKSQVAKETLERTLRELGGDVRAATGLQPPPLPGEKARAQLAVVVAEDAGAGTPQPGWRDADPNRTQP